MKLSARQYAEALYASIAENPTRITETMRGFIALLQKNRQRQLLPLILQAVENIETESKGQLKVRVETALPLSTDQQKNLISDLRKQFKQYEEIIIDESVNPELIGGLRLKIGEITIDNSFSAKLQKLSAQL